MPEITYREYRTEDLSAVREILKNDLGYDVPSDELNGKINKMLSLGNYKIFVACCGKSVVGFVGAVSFIAFEVKNDAMKIIALAVNVRFRGQGIGTKLLKKVESYAEENSVGVILLNSGLQRDKAHGFYESQGYKKKSYGFIKGL